MDTLTKDPRVQPFENLSDSAEERNLIACTIRSQEAWLRVSNLITVSDFTHPINRALWDVIDKMRGDNSVPSPVSVADKLPTDIKPMVEALGGWEYIDSLMKIPVDPLGVEQHAKRLHELTVLRRGRQAGESITKLADKGGPSDTFLQKVDEIVNDIPGEIGTEVILLGSIVTDYIDEKRANPKKIPGISTGYPILDANIQGLQPGRMYILGARTGMGKSVWCLNLVKKLAIDQGIPVLYISTEQSATDEISRLISIVADTPEHYINNGTFVNMNDYPERVAEAEIKIKDAPIHFSHDPFFSPEKLYRTIKKFVITEGVKAVFFDYIRIPQGNIASKDKWALVGDLSYGLKAIASDLKVPVISAVQVNRDGSQEFKATGEIDGSSFALSDMIEQSASVAMVLRPLNHTEQKDYPDYKFKRVITFSKNRHGSSSDKILYTLEETYVKLSELKSLAKNA
jgi:replicative DNA helicase